MPIKYENYKLIRQHFIKLLGMKCAICGIPCDKDGTYVGDDSEFKQIEFDHIKPNGIHRHDVSRSKRVWEWFKAYSGNNLQLLCAKCNKEKLDRT